jgi:hypothetical protein
VRRREERKTYHDRVQAICSQSDGARVGGSTVRGPVVNDQRSINVESDSVICDFRLEQGE